MLNTALRFLLLMTFLVMGCNPESYDNDVIENSIEDDWQAIPGNAYVSLNELWSTPEIHVCFYNPTPDNKKYQEWTKNAFLNSWPAHSLVTLTGFDKCEGKPKGLSIKLTGNPNAKWGDTDTNRDWPNSLYGTLALLVNGNDPQNRPWLDGKWASMTLNYATPNCAPNAFEGIDGKSHQQNCFEWTAVHELGHGLSFVHEQNREDNPSWCTEFRDPSGDFKATEDYDPNSVMNYCNKGGFEQWTNGKFQNWGNLSELDKKGVAKVYGAKHNTLVENKTIAGQTCFSKGGVSDSFCESNCDNLQCGKSPAVEESYSVVIEKPVAYSVTMANVTVQLRIEAQSIDGVSLKLSRNGKAPLTIDTKDAVKNGNEFVISLTTGFFSGDKLAANYGLTVVNATTNEIIIKSATFSPSVKLSGAPPTTYSWNLGSFGGCSVDCNDGTQTRAVTCIDDTTKQTVADTKCTGSKPATSQSCAGSNCGVWFPKSWGACSEKCGDGTQTRFVACLKGTEVDEAKCLNSSKPATTQNCKGTDCGNPTPEKDGCWYGTYWTAELGSTRTCLKADMSQCDAGKWGYYKGTEANCCAKAFSWALAPHCLVMSNPGKTNTAPVATASTATTAQGVAVEITLQATDEDNDPLTYTVVAQPTNGALSGTGNKRTYTPNAGFSGADSFTFKANDGTDDSGTVTVAITVTSSNTAPVAKAGTATTAQDVSVEITLEATDADSDSLTYTIVSNPSHGSLSGTGNKRTYAPNAGFSGVDSFSFKANDGTVDSSTVTVDITVTKTNSAPVAQAGSTKTDQDTAVVISLLATDADSDSLTYTIVTQPTQGQLTGSGASRTYTPNTGFFGSDEFTFKVNDGTVDSAAAKVTIEVTKKTVDNATPVAQAGQATTEQGKAVSITLVASDADSDPLTYIIVTQPTHGTLVGTGASRTYTPTATFFGSDSFTFKVNDGKADSATVTVTITVIKANTAPVAQTGSAKTEQDKAVSITLVANDADGDVLTYTIVTQPANGSLAGTGASRTYTPTSGFFGNDSFSFKVNDGQADSQTVTVSIEVTKKATSGGDEGCWYGTYWTAELGSTRTCIKESMSKCDAGNWGYYKGTKDNCCKKHFSWATPPCLK